MWWFLKPNILFVTIDALRADKTYGKNKTSTTPHIDSLISKGVYFEQTIAAADQTGSSLASIFTSNFPITSGINQFNFSSKTETMLNIFKKKLSKKSQVNQTIIYLIVLILH